MRLFCRPLALPSSQVSKPFFATLHRWIFHGDLDDPFHEFFVSPNPELAGASFVRLRPFLGVDEAGAGGGRGGAGVESHLLWEQKYVFRGEMLPSFVSEEFGRKVRDLPRPCPAPWKELLWLTK